MSAKKRKGRAAPGGNGRARQIVVSVVIVLLIGGMIGGVAFGVGALKDRVAEARSAPLRLEIAWPALAGDASRTWLPESARREITAAVMSKLTANPFDRGSLVRARKALLETGWFERVDRVRRKTGGVVEIGAVWRTPGAVVRWEGKDYLVSSKGELLPLVYEAGDAGRSVLVIEGVDVGPTRTSAGAVAYGEAWPGASVRASLELMGVLRRAFGAGAAWSQIAGIDASEFRTRGRLAIISDAGARIVWGAPPGKLAPGEQTTEQKLMRLARLASGPTGRIDSNERYLEIQGPHVFIDQSARMADGSAGGGG
ncbi:MAG: hypothetical protein AB7G17_12885 [Phycisphaerales bacterium]